MPLGLAIDRRIDRLLSDQYTKAQNLRKSPIFRLRRRNPSMRRSVEMSDIVRYAVLCDVQFLPIGVSMLLDNRTRRQL